MIEDSNVANGEKMNFLKVKAALKRYDELWKEWRNLRESRTTCFTIYSDLAFKNKKEASIGDLVEKFRIKVKK